MSAVKNATAVSQHVVVSVAMSSFSFDSESLSTESIVSSISIGTHLFLSFSFENGVEITSAKVESSTIVFITKMPIGKIHQQAKIACVGGARIYGGV